MSGYRYWRIYITANNGDSYVSISELELRGTVGGADLTTPSTPAFESSYYGPNYSTAAKAIDNVDGNASAAWVSDGGALPQWVYYDLGSPTPVAEISIRPEVSAPLRAPRDFLVQGSDDAINWTTITPFSGVTGYEDYVEKTFLIVLPEALTGTVQDPSGNPIQCTVRSYHRDTGALVDTTLSDPTTGAFSLSAANLDEHFVIVFDDVKNALIYDHITPVAA